MKYAILALALATSMAHAEPPAGYCEVIICNKLSRFTLDPFSYLKDKMGETCTTALIEKSAAVEGNVLSSETRWYQGGFNPTKKSVTKVKSVGACGK